jgi:hypothetical protein
MTNFHQEVGKRMQVKMQMEERKGFLSVRNLSPSKTEHYSKKQKKKDVNCQK